MKKVVEIKHIEFLLAQARWDAFWGADIEYHHHPCFFAFLGITPIHEYVGTISVLPRIARKVRLLCSPHYRTFLIEYHNRKYHL